MASKPSKAKKPMRVFVVVNKDGQPKEAHEFRQDAVAQADNWDIATPFRAPHRVVEFVEVKPKRKARP